MSTLSTHKLRLYISLIRLDRPIGIMLLLWPTLWALFLAAKGTPDPMILIIFISGVVLMRSAGCAINDYADRKLDRYVSRTKMRPLASGMLQPRDALVIFALLTCMAFTLVLLTNRLTLYLSIGALCLAIIYPFMKRVTFMPQVALGAAFSMAIPMAFAAQTNTVPSTAWLLFISNLVWTVAYDTIYAMADRKEDIKAGIKSTAVLFAEKDVAVILCLQGLFILGLYFVGQRLQLSNYYYVGLLAATVLMVYEYTLIETRQPQNCIRAFLHNNYVGISIFIGILADLYLPPL